MGEYDINKLAQKIYLQNVEMGWWDDPERCIFQTLQLVCTEVAEATEGERKDLMDDHLPHRKMGEVELADALIRLLDLGGRCGCYYTEVVDPEFQFGTGTVGAMHLSMNYQITNLAAELQWLRMETNADSYYRTNQDVDDVYSANISLIFEAGKLLGYDILGATLEKLEYNKNRADHKRENREKVGGKAF